MEYQIKGYKPNTKITTLDKIGIYVFLTCTIIFIPIVFLYVVGLVGKIINKIKK